MGRYVCGGGDAFKRMPDVMTELHRLDLDFWGNARTAAVIRCVAAANWQDGRPGKLSGIAATLQFGVATVHSHLASLRDWTDPESGEPLPLVERVTGGYNLTAAGGESVAQWTDTAIRILSRSGTAQPGCGHAKRRVMIADGWGITDKAGLCGR